MTKNSFQFGNFNSVDDWGIKIKSHDFLFPPKRECKVVIPNKSGAYDYGAKYYDERVLTMECIIESQITNSQLRQIAGILVQKNKIVLYNEPTVHYVGEVYNPADVMVYPQEKMREFTLDFICEPFAYSEIKSYPLHTGDNKIPYNGTIETPCLIILKNSGNAATKIQITTVKRG